MNKKLRQARFDRRWSVNEAARRVGVSRNTYVRWEQGKQMPHTSTLDLVCKAFRLLPEQLGFEEEVVSEKTEQPETAEIQSEPLLELWKPDPLDPTTASRFSVWSFLIEEEASFNDQKMLYDQMVQEILTEAFQWKEVGDLILVIPQVVQKALGKFDSMHQDHLRPEVRITRHHALLNIAEFPIQLYGLTSFRFEPRFVPPSEEILALCATGLAVCSELRQYELEGKQAIRRILSAYLPALEHYAQQSSPYQRAAAHLAVQGYVLVSNIAVHYGRLSQMEAACRMARFYGQLARDPNLEAIALVRLAIKYSLEDCYSKELDAYQEAVALQGFADISPLLRGRICAGLAGVHAFGQQTGLALSFLQQAREIYGGNPQSDPNYMFAYSEENALTLLEGRTLTYIGRYAEAAAVFSRFGTLAPQTGLRETHRSKHLNCAASVATRERNLEAAVTYLEAALDIAWTIQNRQRLSEIRETLSKLQLLWPDEPEVKRLQEKMYDRQR